MTRHRTRCPLTPGPPTSETADPGCATMGGMFRHLRTAFDEHRQIAARIGVAMLVVAFGLLVVGGAIRVLRAAGRQPSPTAPSSSATSEWTATLDTPVTGLAIEENRLYVASDQLTIFPVSCVVDDGRCAPRWRGVVADGPLSVPTIRDERIFAGSAEGQLYAFPATCDGEGCPPDWIGVAGSGPVSQPAANFDFVYATSDELYAFPVGCASEAFACAPAWTADVPGRPASGAPSLGDGLVVVGSSSNRGGVSAYPAACEATCEPVWTARFDGPATSVAIGDGFAFTVARGRLLAFPMSCTARCEPAWRAHLALEGASTIAAAGSNGAAIVTGAEGAPVFADGRIYVGGSDGRLWVFASSCEGGRCEPIGAHDVAATPLLPPAIDGDTAIVTSVSGSVTLIDLACDPLSPCPPVTVLRLGSAALAPAIFGPEAAIAGSDGGSLESAAR